MSKKKIAVLDKGFVRLVNYMASDAAVTQAARVSYGKGTKSVSDDRTLIRYLTRHQHTSPFEMCEFKFHIKIPMDAWRQMVRHRTANINEYSTRYSNAINERQETHEGAWRFQAKNNKQGSSGFLEDDGNYFSMREKAVQEQAFEVYKERLDAGIAREQARKDLPLSTYTEAYWKIDLRNLFHFLKLRMDEHAQYEIRQYANAIYELIKPIVPVCCKAFEDYILNAVTFSKQERALLEYCLRSDIREQNIKTLGDEYKMSSRELKEFKAKLGV